MLRKLSAVLLATALIAGPAFAAEPASGGSNPPAAASAPANTTTQPAVKSNEPAKTASHTRKPVAGHKTGKVAMVRHKSVKTHRHVVVAHAAKPAKVSKVSKAGKTDKTSKTVTPANSTRS